MNAEKQLRRLAHEFVQSNQKKKKSSPIFHDGRVNIIQQEKMINLIRSKTKEDKYKKNFHRSFKTVQYKWNKENVNKYLGANNEGYSAVKNLNEQGYTVMKVANVKMKRKFTDDKEPHEEDLISLGWHNRPKRVIAINDDKRDNQEAASTIVHEVTHANQHKANEEAALVSKPLPYDTMIKKELDAHIKQEEFNFKIGLPPKHPTFRDETGKINPDGILAFLKIVYGGGGRPFVMEERKFDKLEEIKPWPYPIELNPGSTDNQETWD